MSHFKYLVLILGLLYACSSQKKQKPVKIELATSYGNVILELSDETPLHRDNFVKLTNEGYFDGMLFHRVINGFGIQSGDPDSKTAKPGEALGNGGPVYTIPAEINTELFHKRGALNAARDNNPDRASAGSQFFIVQGKVQTDSTLERSEKRINNWLAEYYFVNDPTNKAIRDSFETAMKAENEQAYMKWADSIQSGGKSYTNFERYSYPEAHREVYKTIGGAPHLDQNYTVFGEVIEGMNIVDSIAAQPVDSLDRPLNDVRIITARIVEE
ncbi:peptidylprolyl isomerase [Maribellus sediminis]|uniref:peptidylprolyl isomerase n=1 Tax=Maribellus sediminis TaxID=2696285 RepID=UPI0014304D37|nr:peptidylprolyl isomerase [Maribellus sediminis]